jgi:hypothetical protein
MARMLWCSEHNTPSAARLKEITLHTAVITFHAMTPTTLVFVFSLTLVAADLPGSKDPQGVKRYEGSEIIGYRPAKFDEYILPLSIPTKLCSASAGNGESVPPLR